MLGVSGVEKVYAIKKAVAWNTAVQCGALDGILLLPHSVNCRDALKTDDSQGAVWTQGGDRGARVCDGQLVGYLRFDGCDLLLACFAGIAGVPVLHAGGAASYDYIYDLAAHTDGLFLTFAESLKTYVAENPSLKIAGITLKAEADGVWQLLAKVIGDDRVNDGVNTLATMADVTIAETENRVLFAQTKFFMNGRDDIALAAGDQIYPSSFELTAERNLMGEYTGEYRSASDPPQDLIDEPRNNGMLSATLKLQFARHASKTYLEDLRADVRKKIKIEATGKIIEAAIRRQVGLLIPHAQLLNVNPVDEAGNIKEPLEFQLHGASGLVAGMEGVTAPLRIYGINQRATNPLA